MSKKEKGEKKKGSCLSIPFLGFSLKQEVPIEQCRTSERYMQKSQNSHF